ncbi:LSU ribosomal protein L29P [Paramaledivibacter caminithermalis DSM 15212]|jgi:large subunit ribosomal protein L29|uniref:Large ribosomal subunit protein uL29 n=1 Tax=Paramaledivibacter caminithermalis (strain DSM 15212 / CIP 107654 / DViRD3) TaxID=1121301 RepID=A0A1M6RUF6_PARC5|nr:LSU ribosomal protein L29P [Paramaledivibacter caminithermalis DSM 15212]
MVKQVKANKLRDMTSQELSQKLNDLKAELFNLRFQLATGQLENPMTIRTVKKDIARVKTILRERELKEINQ